MASYEEKKKSLESRLSQLVADLERIGQKHDKGADVSEKLELIENKIERTKRSIAKCDRMLKEKDED